jgi:hypothetical protein
MLVVRRLLCCLILSGFTVSLHASLPSVNNPTKLNRSGNSQFEIPLQDRPTLGMTASPANASFYEEFYPVTMARPEQPRTGVLHWVGSIIKKGRQKIALLSPQKFF